MLSTASLSMMAKKAPPNKARVEHRGFVVEDHVCAVAFSTLSMRPVDIVQYSPNTCY